MEIQTELNGNPKIKELIQQSKMDGFRQGIASVFVSYSHYEFEENINNLRENLNKIVEQEFPRYAERGLLYHQISPSIENYWKNVGSYFFMAIDDLHKEIEDEDAKKQMNLL